MKKLLDTDARFFGMRVWPNRQRLTDAEYVERVRKSLQMTRRLRYLYGLIGIVTMFCVVWGVHTVIKDIIAFAGAQAQQNMIWSVAVTAAIVSAGVSATIGGMALHIAHLFVGERKDRLLVECWDTLQVVLTSQNVEMGMDSSYTIRTGTESPNGPQ
jgi:hypothetical protein